MLVCFKQKTKILKELFFLHPYCLYLITMIQNIKLNPQTNSKIEAQTNINLEKTQINQDLNQLRNLVRELHTTKEPSQLSLTPLIGDHFLYLPCP